MKGQRVAVFGLARSGLAIARATTELGGHAVVVDEKPEGALRSRSILEEARAAGAEVRLGWGGEFSRDWADLVVTSPGVPMRHPRLRQAVERGIDVISEVEFAYRISRAPIVAITGTNGKSTTAVMTWLCLRAAGEDAVLCGNIYGSGYDEVPLTEAAMRSSEDQVLVAEISSFQLEWVREFRPVSAGITNIAPDHLDRYEGFKEYAGAKTRIFARQGPEEFAVVRAHDPVVAAPKGPRVLTFGAMGEHGRVADDALYLLNLRVPLEGLPFYGSHNHANAAMAALLAYGTLRWKARKSPEGHAAGMLRRSEEQAAAARPARSVFGSREADVAERVEAMPPEIVEGLRGFRGLAHRMEDLGERGGVRVINNSMCTNPSAVVASAMAVRETKHLLLGGTNKKLDFRPLQNYLASGHNKAYLFGRDAAALQEQLGSQHPVFATMREAFEAAAANARPGEVIMLAPGCASMDQFEDFRDRGNVFKAIAKEWLRT